jgi:hypothetical protein
MGTLSSLCTAQQPGYGGMSTEEHDTEVSVESRWQVPNPSVALTQAQPGAQYSSESTEGHWEPRASGCLRIDSTCIPCSPAQARHSLRLWLEQLLGWECCLEAKCKSE